MGKPQVSAALHSVSMSPTPKYNNPDCFAYAQTCFTLSALQGTQINAHKGFGEDTDPNQWLTPTQPSQHPTEEVSLSLANQKAVIAWPRPGLMTPIIYFPEVLQHLPPEDVLKVLNAKDCLAIMQPIILSWTVILTPTQRVL